MKTTMLEPIIVTSEPQPLTPTIFPTINPFTEIQKQQYHFSRRISYNSHNAVSYVGLKQTVAEIEQKLLELNASMLDFPAIYVILNDLDKLVQLYAEWITEDELNKLKSFRQLITEYEHKLNTQRTLYQEKETLAQKAENDNKARFGLAKVNPRDWDLILSVTGSARLWWHYVSKHKIDEINSKQKFIDELVLLNDLLSELNQYAYQLRSRLEVELEQRLQKTDNRLLLARKAPVSSFDMMKHYWNGGGSTVTLSALGIRDKIIALVKTPNQLGKQNNRSVHGDFIQQIIQTNRKHFRNTYDFRHQVGALDINNPLWAIGGATIEGEFLGGVINIADKFYLKGEIHYKFYDKFTDPYDIFNLIPGEWNPDGDSYDIQGDWKETIFVEISQKDYLKLKN